MAKLGVLGDIGEEVVGELIEQGKQGAKQAVKTPKDLGSSAVSQTGLSSSNSQNQEVVDHLYGNTKNQNQNQSLPKNDQRPQGKSEKSPDEVAKIKKLHQELHNTAYFIPTFEQRASVKKEEAEEEREEEMEERQEEEEKKFLEEKKKESLPVTRQQQRVEKFPGASG